MDAAAWLTLATLFIAGFTACAEFGSYAFVHPVIRRLPLEHHVAVEQGLVKTFGRVMPFLMTGSLALVIGWASMQGFPPAAIVAVVLWSAGLVTTISVNVAINLRTARGGSSDDPEAWRAMRARWEWFQGFRSWVFLASFAAVCVEVALGTAGLG